MSHCRLKLGLFPFLLLSLAQSAHPQDTARIAGPLVVSSNPHYFKDANGKALILAGSQTWNTLQDWGSGGSAQALDFPAFVKFLTAHGQNFTLLWRVEMPKFCSLPSTSSAPPDFTVSPQPWQRTGPGNATDGGLKFDLTKFNQAYFDRLRGRTKALNDAGIYAGIYLFTGEFINLFRCASDGYPFTGANNINGIDDGYTSGPKGMASMTMTAPNDITRYQDAFVEKVIDTLNDLPNVLWIVSEEAPSNTKWFNYYQIAHIRKYEAQKPHQHPIGLAGLLPSGAATDAILYNSNADWVAPNSTISPITSCGSGTPACKVNVNDSDHSYFGGAWKDTPQQNRNYIWKNFANGSQVLFMDPYLVYYPRENRNLCISPTRGICSAPATRYENFRDNLGYTVKYSRKLNLVNVNPHPALSSTGYCLAQTPPAGAEYLVYAPSGGSFTVDLSAMPRSRSLKVEWFNPASARRLSSLRSTPARPPSRSARRSAATQCSTWWIRRDMQTKIDIQSSPESRAIPLLKAQIKTPALVVDMDAMEGNIKKMAAFFGEGPTRLRPHYKNHKCVALARRQLAAGAIGITCATLGEAEALARNGITGILLANEIAGAPAIERLVQIARVTDIMVGVDNERTIAALSAASARARVPLSVVVDVNTGMGRCGVLPGEPVLALAQLAVAQGLRLRGLIGYEGHCVRLKPGPDKVKAIHEAMGKLVDSANLVRAHGLTLEIVSAGGTGTHTISGRFPGVTEIQGGSYMLWDTDYQTVCPEFELALSVLGTVISRSGNERLILDIGLKEISGERGVPVLKNADGARLRKLNAEHSIVDIVDPDFPAQVGDQLEIWAHYSDATVNLHRHMYGLRDGRVEETFLLES